MKCGFFKKDITPPIGQYMSGKAMPRIAQGVEDPLYVRALAFEEEKRAIVMVFDFAGMRQELCQRIRCYVAQKMGLDQGDILIACTHTHTGPVLCGDMDPADADYVAALPTYALAAAQGAVADLKEAAMLGAQDVLEKVTYIRRFRMKDGTVRTNPGRNNPDVLEPMSPADETIRLVRFVREGAEEILLVNFQVHPDVMNTTGYSADYPGVVCKTLEQALPGTHCIYFNGTAGDLNHIDIHTPAWDPNVGPAQALHMGRSIAGKALMLYTKARPLAAGAVRTIQKPVTIHLRAPEPERVPESREIVRLHEAGLDDQLPYTGMELVTAYFEARQIIERSQPGYQTEKTVTVSGLSVGDLCVVGIPGEPFCEIGRRIREDSPFAMQLTLGICNGYEGYFPTADAFEVNGYESRTSRFVPGIGEAMMEAGRAVTASLRKNEI